MAMFIILSSFLIAALNKSLTAFFSTSDSSVLYTSTSFGHSTGSTNQLGPFIHSSVNDPPLHLLLPRFAGFS